MTDSGNCCRVLNSEAATLHVSSDIKTGNYITVVVINMAFFVAFQTANANQHTSSAELAGIEGSVLDGEQPPGRFVEVFIIAAVRKIVIALDGLQGGIFIDIQLIKKLLQRLAL